MITISIVRSDRQVRSETDQPSVPWVFLIPFLNTWGLFPFSSQWEPMDVTLQAPWICASSGSSDGLKADVSTVGDF